MKSEDIVAALARALPEKTDYFTSNFSVVSMARAGTTVTATTTASHNFETNKGVFITGAKTPLTITSFTRVGEVGTIVTDTAHDITLGSQPSVEVEDAAEAEFNGVFIISGVPDRFTLTVAMDDSGATTATGSPIVIDASSCLQQYNGLHKVTGVPSATSFTFEISNTLLLDPRGDIEARGNVRITSAVSPERIEQAYTKQPPNDCWLFVVLGDTDASRDRNNQADSVSNLGRGNYFRQQLTQSVSLYLFIPASQEISGRNARDLAEDLFQPICKSILFRKFPNYVSENLYHPLNFVAHGFQAYNTATYVHRYDFQQTYNLLFADTVGVDEHVAFRDIDLTQAVDVGSGELETYINLDEES